MSRDEYPYLECDDKCGPSNKLCSISIPCCNLDINIKKVNPIIAYNCKPLILVVSITDCCFYHSLLNISIKPLYGYVHLEKNGMIIYRAKRGYVGMDCFQLMVEDEAHRKCYENVIIEVRNLYRGTSKTLNPYDIKEDKKIKGWKSPKKPHYNPYRTL